MANIKNELIEMMNEALKLEHAARIQYLSHVDLISGPNAEKIIERLQEIADDEKKHEDKFRSMIGSFLGGVSTMKMADTHEAKDLESVLKVNLKDEKDAIDFHKQIYSKIIENKNNLPYNFVTLEHELRHIIMDEEEHITELSLLLG
jgi:bacterioferritin (cytochrome b1)